MEVWTQVFSFAGFITGVLIAASTSGFLQAHLSKLSFISETFAPLVAFILVFAVIQGAFAILAHIVEKFLRKIKLGVVDKILGGFVGGGKAVLVISLILFLAGYIGFPGKKIINDSALYSHVYPIMPSVWKSVAGAIPDGTGVDFIDE